MFSTLSGVRLHGVVDVKYSLHEFRETLLYCIAKI